MCVVVKTLFHDKTVNTTAVIPGFLSYYYYCSAVISGFSITTTTVTAVIPGFSSPCFTAAAFDTVDTIV
jgi:hypothetical protein